MAQGLNFEDSGLYKPSFDQFGDMMVSTYCYSSESSKTKPFRVRHAPDDDNATHFSIAEYGTREDASVSVQGSEYLHGLWMSLLLETAFLALIKESVGVAVASAVAVDIAADIHRMLLWVQFVEARLAFLIPALAFL
ncbi:hypothetical protein PC129_g24489 [Phytophthora cactorum]|uniref:Uncharacterized protein n=2 Tax=Phytophthora cactorum TaxID=29920 RepID=A0A8T1GVR0_9STRA|nr:hypothetical protein Pcac1_g25080 [Phytophthora cactorum]KAG2763315.1 hypothetical protein Pcac1_g25071 [Phytophthora cactorum]KAG2769610.1 hypothetical protein Pcac1_g19081 [Phytophthora cactorum]KAG2769614.1 hypothetical protein Pcac1_g19085 [Phytophthora cactorum]KAG3197717.1 hypothetical protein PC129_g24489 [Phytophthora cactorum]